MLAATYRPDPPFLDEIFLPQEAGFTPSCWLLLQLLVNLFFLSFAAAAFTYTTSPFLYCYTLTTQSG